jgi:hypothetical protein
LTQESFSGLSAVLRDSISTVSKGSSKKRRTKLLGWITDHVAGTLVGLLVTAAIAAGTAWFIGQDPTTGQQIDQVRSTLEKGGLEVRAFQKLSLHAGAMSYLFAIGEQDGFEPDEIRIYDQEGGSFHEGFSFVPAIKSQNSEVKTVPSDFNVLSVTDPDGDGQNELLGSYDITAPRGVVRLPVTIIWSPAESEYRLAPLLSEPPNPKVGGGTLTGEAITPFESPYVINVQTESLKAWAAESLVLLRKKPLGFSSGGLFLGTGYPAPEQQDQLSTGQRLQISYWGVSSPHHEESPSANRLCWNVSGKRFLPEEVRGNENLEAAIKRGWNHLIEADERSRRGEVSPDEALYIGGFGPNGECFLGE